MFLSDLLGFIEQLSLKTNSFNICAKTLRVSEFKIQQIISIYFFCVCTKIQNLLWQIEDNEFSYKCQHVIWQQITLIYCSLIV